MITDVSHVREHAARARVVLFTQGLQLASATEQELTHVFRDASYQVQKQIAAEIIGRSGHRAQGLVAMLVAAHDTTLRESLMYAIVRHPTWGMRLFNEIGRYHHLSLYVTTWNVLYSAAARARDATLEDLQRLAYHTVQARYRDAHATVIQIIAARAAALSDAQIVAMVRAGFDNYWDEFAAMVGKEIMSRPSFSPPELMRLIDSLPLIPIYPFHGEAVMGPTGARLWLASILRDMVKGKPVREVLAVLPYANGEARDQLLWVLVKHPGASTVVLLNLFDAPRDEFNHGLKGWFVEKLAPALSRWSTRRLCAVLTTAESAQLRRLCFRILAKRADCSDGPLVDAYKQEPDQYGEQSSMLELLAGHWTGTLAELMRVCGMRDPEGLDHHLAGIWPALASRLGEASDELIRRAFTSYQHLFWQEEGPFPELVDELVRRSGDPLATLLALLGETKDHRIKTIIRARLATMSAELEALASAVAS